ncbi:c-type cytochrome [Sulfuritalea sp.]|uniref:c-type cytochrome n=1 Tax=Sulfuritalea sp. TaxID=2480090 RepID=UPI001ACE8BE5|nr:c-type cytochrome [Sulfuritalea sp.]MBN8473980.1 cytochrome c4 [Sulfuritalea sp.]
MTITHVLAALVCATLASVSVAAAKPGGNAAAGQQKAGACGACHGADGNSPPEIFAALKAPKLAGQVPEYITKSLHDFKAGRRSNEVMSPQAQAVAEVDIADIAAWFSSQKVQPNKAQSAELLAQGEKIFFKGKGRPDVIAACVGCHGLNGIGNRDWAKTMSRVPAVLAPAIGGQHAGYLGDQLKAYKSGKRATDPGRVMRDIAGRMDEKDILAVAEYISTLGR